MTADQRPGRPVVGQPHGATHRPPSTCPVCGEGLALTRLGCTACGTEIGGVFRTCEFCSLGQDDLDTLRVFLASRGNLREVERHLGVSYPTARLRFTQILTRLGLADGGAAADDTPGEPVAPDRDQILAEVASGALTPSEAAALLRPPTQPV